MGKKSDTTVSFSAAGSGDAAKDVFYAKMRFDGQRLRKPFMESSFFVFPSSLAPTLGFSYLKGGYCSYDLAKR